MKKRQLRKYLAEYFKKYNIKADAKHVTEFVDRRAESDLEKQFAVPVETILTAFNKATGKKLKMRLDSPNARAVRRTLKQGFSVGDWKDVIIKKVQDPFFKENPHLMNPLTLSRNFENYLNEKQTRERERVEGR